MDDKLVHLLGRLAAGLGTAKAHEVSNLARNGEWAKLQQLRCVPSDYTSPEQFWADSVPVELLRKCKLDLGVDTKSAAVTTFYDCERQCCATNSRLFRFLPEQGGFGLSPTEWRLHEFFVLWRQEILTILGPLPSRLVPRFSNGATVSNKSSESSIPDKMTGNPTYYASTRDLLPFFWETSWGWAVRGDGGHPKVVRGNHFFTVTKDSEKDRGCCKEASVNVSFQLAVGKHIRERLLEVLGLDLRTAQDLHKELARLASLFGEHATIDMSNASDTVSRLLVALGLHGPWYQLLDSLRAPMTFIGGKWVYLEKFSSMGNGFTFELETLLFLTLARVMVRSEGGDPDSCSCYGDDLIVPTAHASSVLAVLRFCGFTPNQKKTFLEGPFRESCGGDYFSGVPVRAHNLESIPLEPQHWISLANALRRICRGIPSRWEAIRPAWRFVLQQLPTEIRACRGPEHLGDIVIHDDEEFWNVKYVGNPADSIRYRVCRTYSPVGLSYELERWSTNVQLAACHLVGATVSRRGNVVGYKNKWVPCDYTSFWEPPIQRHSKPMR